MTIRVPRDFPLVALNPFCRTFRTLSRQRFRRRVEGDLLYKLRDDRKPIAAGPAPS